MIPSLENRASQAADQTSGSNTKAQSNISTGDTLVNEQTFLKLLVAQLQNQDPLQPQDGIQFVAQLAQFSSLEQQIQMRQDLDSINQVMNTADSGTGQAAES